MSTLVTLSLLFVGLLATALLLKLAGAVFTVAFWSMRTVAGAVITFVLLVMVFGPLFTTLPR